MLHIPIAGSEHPTQQVVTTDHMSFTKKKKKNRMTRQHAFSIYYISTFQLQET